MSRFSVHLFSTLPEDELICSVCNGVLDEPFAPPCRHTFCRACIVGAAEASGSSKQCPRCKKSFQWTDFKPPALAVQTPLRKLEMNCQNDGCDEVYAMEDYDSHQMCCEFAPDTPPPRAPRDARIKNKFVATVAGDESKACIEEILYLPGGLVLLADGNNSCLKLFDDLGNFLCKRSTVKGHCKLAYLGRERVALLNCQAQNQRIEVLKVSASEIKIESEGNVEKQYRSIASLDQHTLAAPLEPKHAHGIDILSRKGQVLRSIATSEKVRRAYLSSDGFLVCAYKQGTLKIDALTGLEIHKNRLPQAGRLRGVTTIQENFIVACDESKNTIFLLDKDGNLVQNLWSPPKGDKLLKYVSVLGDMIVCCTQEKVFVLESEY